MIYYVDNFCILVKPKNVDKKKKKLRKKFGTVKDGQLGKLLGV